MDQLYLWTIVFFSEAGPMVSPIEDLFARALGLEAPWQLARVTFSEEDRELHLYLDFKRGGRFSCPDCGEVELTAYDTQDKKWRHLDFFQHQAFLHARVPRVRCPSCGVRQVAVPWARSGSGFTLLFEALIMTLVQDLPVKALARLIGEHDTRIWRVLRHYIDEARSREDYQDVHRIGIDETARKRGHQYVSLFVDLDRSRVLFTTSGKDQSTVSAFADDFVVHGGDPNAVTDVCCDMSPAFIAGVEKDLPEAKITFDRFHVMKIIGDAVDKVRRAEQKDIKELKGSRYLWLRNPETLKTDQQERLTSL
ncbi:MAG TPA: ISL3 family transposase, partial [Euryarchaeota archaeon]|nr:ISL3 family transposase [Euryarchaeota archaeon]